MVKGAAATPGCLELEATVTEAAFEANADASEVIHLLWSFYPGYYLFTRI